MSFIGTSMIFDGIACEEMGLYLYDFDSHKQSETNFTSNLAIIEDRIDGRYRSLFYGGSVNEPLTFTMVLCANEDRAYRNEPFDRWDLQKIASWLTGHNSYKWLQIVQPDLEDVRFRCIISELEAVEVVGNKWGFSCTVTCDSPFGYLLPRSYEFPVDGSQTCEIFSESSYNGLYYPKLIIDQSGNSTISIKISNDSETSVFEFTKLPTSIGAMVIDCENGVIHNGTLVGNDIAVEGDLNPYEYITYNNSFHFPRLARGKNTIELTGTATYRFICEWPVNVGG